MVVGKFELKPAKGGKFMFNLKATNGQVILTSETYETKKAAEKGIASVRKSAANARHKLFHFMLVRAASYGLTGSNAICRALPRHF